MERSKYFRSWCDPQEMKDLNTLDWRLIAEVELSTTRTFSSRSNSYFLFRMRVKKILLQYRLITILGFPDYLHFKS